VTNDSTEPPALESGAAGWRKSSFSGVGECVEVASGSHQIAIRNSNDPEAGTLLFSGAEMAAWIAGIKAGEFDDLAG
jgi:hypothetical protein